MTLKVACVLKSSYEQMQQILIHCLNNGDMFLVRQGPEKRYTRKKTFQ